jgi:hypothetical protein
MPSFAICFFSVNLGIYELLLVSVAPVIGATFTTIVISSSYDCDKKRVKKRVFPPTNNSTTA